MPVNKMRPGVFLDRDGTLNELVYHQRFGEYGPPHRPDQLRLFGEVGAALKSLASAGFTLFVVTNQPDHAKAKCMLDDLQSVRAAFDRKIAALGVPIAESYYCYCHPQAVRDGYGTPCPCYKPSPHMILDLAQRHEIDLSNSWMIGDRPSDMLSGKAAGVSTISIARPGGNTFSGPEFTVCSSLLDAVALVLASLDQIH